MTQAQLEKLFGKGAYEKAQQITPVTDELQLERIISWLRLIHLANNTKPHRDDLRRTLLLIPEDDRLFVICQLGDSSFLGRCRKNIKGPGAHNDGGGL